MNHYDFAFDETFGEVANNVEVYQGTARLGAEAPMRFKQEMAYLWAM